MGAFTGSFTGLVAAVTGGGAGIGLATATLLAEGGARVVVLDLAPAGLPDGVDALACDVTDRASVRAAMATIGSRHGGLDVLVNNAGIGAVGTVEDGDDEQWHRVLDVNVVGIARTTAEALPMLRASAHASVVNMCSVAARNGLPQRALYSASKGAVLALTLAMATDHVREGIRVNCVCPGTVHTAWVDRMLEQYDDPVAERAALGARQATGHLVAPEEVAAAVAYLAGPDSVSTTGTALDVDGGLTHLRVRPVEG